jgi:hypothetical protein
VSDNRQLLSKKPDLKDESAGDISSREDQRTTSVRHALMLKAISLTRKAFQEASQVKLPEGYFLESDIGDRNGWPLVTLALLSEPEYKQKLPFLEISSSDSDKKGLVQFALSTGEILGRINLRSEQDFHRLPPFIKRATREFLELCKKLCAELGPIKPRPNKDIPEKKSTEILLMEADIFADNKDKNLDNRLTEEEVEPLEPIELF